MMDYLYNQTITVTKATSYLLEEVEVIPSIFPTYQPVSPGGYINIDVVGNSLPGIVRIIGSKSGAPVTENIPVDSTGHAAPGSSLFDNITSFDVSGFTDGKISAEQIHGQGEPMIREVIASTIMGIIVAKKGYIRSMQAGQQESSNYKMAVMVDGEIKVLPNRFAYAKFEAQGIKKFRITFVTPPGRLGNINADLFLIDNDATMPT